MTEILNITTDLIYTPLPLPNMTTIDIFNPLKRNNMRTILIFGFLFLAYSINYDYMKTINDTFLFILIAIAICGDIMATAVKIKKLNK